MVKYKCTQANLPESWKVTLLETGLSAMTGARIKKAKDYIGNETFMLTYGDGLADINIKETLNFIKAWKIYDYDFSAT